MDRERSLDRLITFCDAVVAIAITLLILPLVDSAGELGDLSIGALMDRMWPQLLVFGISFAVIGRFWLAHHRAFEHYIGYNTALLWVNLLWLLSIVFLPFPTELMAQGVATSPATVLLYIGTMVVTSAAATLTQWIVIRNPQLQAPEVRGTLSIWSPLTALVLLVAALLVSQLVPGVGLFALLLMLLSGPVQLLLGRRSPRADSAGTPPPPA